MFKPYEIEWTDEKITKLWDYYATNPAIKDLYFTNLVGGNVLTYLKHAVNFSNKRILDYGSGPGFLFSHIKRLGLNVRYNALDNSKDSIAKLTELYSKEPQFEQAFLVESFPSKIQEKFDIVICCEVVEHLNDTHLNSMIDEFKNILNKDGIVMITTPNEEDLNASKVICPDSGCVFHRWQHVRSWSVQSLSNYMEQNGFVTVKVEATNLLQKNFAHRLKQFLLKSLKSLGYKTGKPQNLVYIGRRR
jgi:2-polyprenyl-3-methyl-5-hydroxy-6-metoxy-1,4-benzoquinol methylase